MQPAASGRRCIHNRWTVGHRLVPKILVAHSKSVANIVHFTVTVYCVFEEHNIKRHYERKYQTINDQYFGSCRKNIVAKLHEEIGGVEKLFNIRRNENEAAVCANFRVAHILSTKKKTFSKGDFVKKCILAVVEKLCQKKGLQSVTLPNYWFSCAELTLHSILLKN